MEHSTTTKKLYGKELLDSLSDKDGIISRDVGYELLMGYKATDTPTKKTTNFQIPPQGHVRRREGGTQKVI